MNLEKLITRFFNGATEGTAGNYTIRTGGSTRHFHSSLTSESLLVSPEEDVFWFPLHVGRLLTADYPQRKILQQGIIHGFTGITVDPPLDTAELQEFHATGRACYLPYHGGRVPGILFWAPAAVVAARKQYPPAYNPYRPHCSPYWRYDGLFPSDYALWLDSIDHDRECLTTPELFAGNANLARITRLPAFPAYSDHLPRYACEIPDHLRLYVSNPACGQHWFIWKDNKWTPCEIDHPAVVACHRRARLLSRLAS